MTDALPHAVLSEVLGERIDDRRLVAAVFLTFEFDPGFFEQEILPVLFEEQFSHVRGIRLVQLEDVLRSKGARVAVYYDADRLIAGDSGSARLDIERVPVRHKTGVFHPKNVLLLLEGTDKDGNPEQSLLIGALSANLTRSSWWENIEVAHFEEIREGQTTRLRDDLRALLRRLRSATAQHGEHAALELIDQFLKGTHQGTLRVIQDTLQPHFYSGTEPLADFLERCAGRLLEGCCLEVLSPFVDADDTCAPLEELIRRFGPKEVRVMLPLSRKGELACRKGFLESVTNLPNVQWGQLGGDRGLKRELAPGGAQRFVHAKVYRFFTRNPKREICLIGSPNLTRAAHQKGGNWETALLVEAECPRRPEFWLTPVTPDKPVFQPSNETDLDRPNGTRLMLRHHWDTHRTEACWEGETGSPPLHLEARNQVLGDLANLKPHEWVDLGKEWADRLSAVLRETSFVKVQGPGEESGLLLVQEVGMSHKPSQLLSLSVAEILRYWALLTPAQRSAFLEAKASEGIPADEAAALVARFRLTLQAESFFDRFAGYFHSFHCLETEVREHLEAGREKEATYRLFGRKYDSLGTLLKQALGADAGLDDDVSRYVVLMCARQLAREVKGDHPEFWHDRRVDAKALETELERSDEVRTRLAAQSPEMPGFLDWFDSWFLKRAKPMEADHD